MMRRLSGACLAALVVVLVANPLFAKPPDLPQDAKIVVSPQNSDTQESLPVEPAIPESGEWRPFREGLERTDGELDPWMAVLREMLSSSLFFEVHPFIAFWGDAGQETPVQTAEPTETASECPYMRGQNQCQPVRVLNPNAIPSVMDNLRALEQAVHLMLQARQLADKGCFDEALDCLAKARGLCPGAPCDRQIEELHKEFTAAADAQKEKTTDATEEEEPEGCGCCCGCCCCDWFCQFGMCWMSQFIDWCKEQSQGNEHEQAQAAEPCEDAPCSKNPYSACPKCEMLHAQYIKRAGIAEQVNGLMKACYLAIGEGRFEKAADLARQAYALDPARVEGDPLIYKLHLFAEQSIQSAPAKCSCPESQCPCPKSQCPKCCPAQKPTPACEDPGLAPMPALPDVSSELPFELDEILTGKDPLAEEACEEQGWKSYFSLIMDPKTHGVSLTQAAHFLHECFQPPPVTERSMTFGLGLDGVGVWGMVPLAGVNYTLFFRDGVFLVWMTPEVKAK